MLVPGIRPGIIAETRGQRFAQPHLFRGIGAGGAGEVLNERHRRSMTTLLGKTAVPRITSGSDCDDTGRRESERLA